MSDSSTCVARLKRLTTPALGRAETRQTAGIGH
jgi:hypothetical protein